MVWVEKCAPIYIWFLFIKIIISQINPRSRGNKKIIFVLITKMPRRYLVSQNEDATTVDVELGNMVRI
jgi:hypothetical protein